MNNLVKLLLFFSLSLSILAQRDPLDELDRWSRKQSENRTYRPGEETWAMATSKMRAEQRANGLTLKPRGTVLTNADIFKMKEAGLLDETVLLAINSRPSSFDLSPATMIAMKEAGYSEAIINAMLGADARNKGNLIPLDKNGMPAEVGIYIQGAKGLTEIDAEPISWQSGGVWKTIITAYFFFPFNTKGHINAKVMGAQSRYQVDPNAEFVIRTPEGVAASEYLLVELYEKDNRREFRLLTGGVVHRSSGAERNATPFTYRKIAPRTYYVMLNNLRRGEYGFLPTHLMNSKDAAFVGKLYSFSVD
jgi:hypothetical protein